MHLKKIFLGVERSTPPAPPAAKTRGSPGYLPIVAYVHSVFATACKLNSSDSASAGPSSSPVSRSPGFLPIVAYAYSVFSTSCGLNSPDIASAHCSIAVKSRSWVYTFVPMVYTSSLPYCALRLKGFHVLQKQIPQACLQLVSSDNVAEGFRFAPQKSAD